MSSFLLITQNEEKIEHQITKHTENGSSSHCVDITTRDFKNVVGPIEGW